MNTIELLLGEVSVALQKAGEHLYFGHLDDAEKCLTYAKQTLESLDIPDVQQ